MMVEKGMPKRSPKVLPLNENVKVLYLIRHFVITSQGWLLFKKEAYKKLLAEAEVPLVPLP